MMKKKYHNTENKPDFLLDYNFADPLAMGLTMEMIGIVKKSAVPKDPKSEIV